MQVLNSLKISLLSLVLSAFLLGSAEAIVYPVGDLNGNYKVNIQDLWVFVEQWLDTNGSDENMVAHWKLNESSGTQTGDTSGYSHDGTLIGNPVWQPTGGKVGGALQLDGIDDYVEITGYQGITGTHARSITAWIKTFTTGEIISWGESTTGKKWIFRVQDTNGTSGAVRLEVAGGYAVGVTDVRDGRWHHVAAVLEDDGTPNTDEIQLYVDGIPEGISALVSQPIDTAGNANVKIGVSSDSNRYFNGWIDDVRIYDKSLSTQEIEAVVKSGRSGPWCADLDGINGVNITDFALLVEKWLEQLYPMDSLTPIYEQAAQYILNQTAVPQRGYCLVFGAGKGRLAYELAIRSNLNIIGVEEDINKINSGRTILHNADVYGDRITLHKGSLEQLDYSDYAARLVVSDSIISSGTCTGSAAEMFRMVRPDGGIAIIGQPAGCPHPLNRADLESWLDADGLTYSITEGSNGLWARIDRGPLPGAGEWTHMWANPSNTACSGDLRITDNFDVLWFGAPGPAVLTDRHARPQAPLYKAGKLVIPGNNRVACVDAYNGAPQWALSVPNSSRIAILRDAGWVAMADDYVYIAAQDKSLKVNLETGTVTDIYKPPVENRDWGYLAIVDDLLFGSTQIPGASFLGPDSDGYYKSHFSSKPIITSQALFCRDRNTGVVIWTYDNNSVIANPSICVGSDGIYFFESRYSQAVSDADGRVPLATFTQGNYEYLVKLDKNTGEVLWSLQKNVPFDSIIYLSYARDILVASGTNAQSGVWFYYLRAYHANDGSYAWSRDINSGISSGNAGHGEQDKHPMIIDNTVQLKQGSFDLQTGTSLGFSFGTSNCADCSASLTHVFSRNGGRPSIYSFNGNGSSSRLCSVMRPGCYISIIPAGGIIMLPAYSAGCTCPYTIQTTIGWLPR